jgi:hypothetical protein
MAARSDQQGELQSARFDGQKWTQADARAFMARHKIHPIKTVDIRGNWLRYRIAEPLGDEGRYYTVKLKGRGDGIEFVFQVPQEHFDPEQLWGEG